MLSYACPAVRVSLTTAPGSSSPWGVPSAGYIVSPLRRDDKLPIVGPELVTPAMRERGVQRQLGLAPCPVKGKNVNGGQSQ